MSEGANGLSRGELGSTAATTAVVLAMVAMAGVAYLLLDILLLLFVGIVVAAAIAPWHMALGRWGIRKSVAVLLIYLLILAALGLVGLVAGPVLLEQLGAFMAEVPASYASGRAYLEANRVVPLHLLGARLPPFESLAQAITVAVPELYRGTLGVTATILTLPGYFVTVLAIAFYWTMEVARFERLALSLLAVERRPRVLDAWREIEAKLGGFIRGQALAMLFIGVASALGYAAIGLPNVLVLGVVAGLLEAVPLIGPFLAVGPAVFVALPSGLDSVLLVLALAMTLQVFESNVLFPRIMHRAVGMSALVGLLAVLAFGTLYGIVGILIAIPMAAVIQVLLDAVVASAEAAAEPASSEQGPMGEVRTRIRQVRHQARVRLRERTSRIGTDEATADGVGEDWVDQQIETAVGRVERMISVAEEASPPTLAVDAQGVVATTAPATDSQIVDEATRRLEAAVEDVETLVAAAEEGEEVIANEDAASK